VKRSRGKRVDAPATSVPSRAPAAPSGRAGDERPLCARLLVRVAAPATSILHPPTVSWARGRSVSASPRPR
jgi:hypothetical protein